MKYELNTEAIAVIAACIILWGVFSTWLERYNITAPIAFVVMGLLVTHEPLNLMHINLESATLRYVAELTLALVLFTDAARVNLRKLRADIGLPIRLLAIGLPLTIGAGMAAATATLGGSRCGWPL